MKLNRILVPVEFSEQSQTAVDYAASLAADCRGLLLIAHIFNPPLRLHGTKMYERAVSDVRRELTHVKPNNVSVPCEYRLAEGDPATEILRLSEKEDADLVVIAGDGRGLSRWVIGGVAEAVVRHASCPVLTLKPGKHVAPTSSPRLERGRWQKPSRESLTSAA